MSLHDYEGSVPAELTAEAVRTDAKQALGALSVRFGLEAPARSLYELLCNTDAEFRNYTWRNEAVTALMGIARSEGIISPDANSMYGDYLRLAGHKDPDTPLVQHLRESSSPWLTERIDTVVQDIEVIYGIDEATTVTSLQQQIKEDEAWNRQHPAGPYRATPNIVEGYDGFYSQNVGHW